MDLLAIVSLPCNDEYGDFGSISIIRDERTNVERYK
jgi:hypothetical protein